jgi:hypothetical protein
MVTGEDWQMVWIGHPWTHVRASGDILHFAKPSEQPDSLGSFSEALCIHRQQLRDAVADAHSQRQSFGRRVEALVAELDPKVSAQAVVEVLLCGHSASPNEAP